MSGALDLPGPLDYSALTAAWERSADVVRRTPLLSAGSLSSRFGGELVLKAENLQRTGSFKVRGALNKLRSLEGVAGVVAGSAGNHAQSLAYAARAFGVDCEVIMPVNAPVGKLAAVRAFGATVVQHGESVDECVELARRRAEESDLVFVHPFDDLAVIAGQAGVGVEIAEEVPELHTVVVPVGGGGLIAGVAAAVRQRRPGARVIGVQAERCAPFPGAIGGGPVADIGAGETIADGIAVKRPGEVTLPLIRELVDDFVTVSEESIAEAMAILMERSKLVVEGAGAASLAAVISGQVALTPEAPTVVVLSGGNVDIGLLAALAIRRESREGRRLRLFTRISDRPGGLARLLAAVAETNANLVSVNHVRESAELEIRQTGIELTLETRGHDHAEQVMAALVDAGYAVKVS